MKTEDERWVVELQPGCWKATWSGDPGRTLCPESARRYTTQHGAKIGLGIARTFRLFAAARVVQVDAEMLGASRRRPEGGAP